MGPGLLRSRRCAAGFVLVFLKQMRSQRDCSSDNGLRVRLEQNDARGSRRGDVATVCEPFIYLTSIEIAPGLEHQSRHGVFKKIRSSPSWCVTRSTQTGEQRHRGGMDAVTMVTRRLPLQPQSKGCEIRAEPSCGHEIDSISVNPTLPNLPTGRALPPCKTPAGHPRGSTAH